MHGVNGKALQTFMGHTNIGITLDRYGHLMPGSEAEEPGLLDTYLEAQRKRDEEAARGLAASYLAHKRRMTPGNRSRMPLAVNPTGMYFI